MASLTRNEFERVLKILYPQGGPGRKLKAKLRSGDVLLGAQLSEFARPALAAQYAFAGMDFLYVEYEHFLFNSSDFTDTILAARSYGLPVVSKTAHSDRGQTQQLLDSGVVGVMIPSTETREQLENLRSWLKFPPEGLRNIAPGYGNSSYLKPPNYTDWMAEQDAESLLIAMIESRLGYENAEELISTPGLDMVYIGPADFSIGVGHPGELEHPTVVRAMEKILDVCKRHNVAFGLTVPNLKAMGEWIDRGAQYFLAADDVTFLYQGASRLVSDFEKLRADRRR